MGHLWSVYCALLCEMGSIT